MPRKRSTPIEQYIEDGEMLNPKARYDKKLKDAGFVRRAYWIHADDVPKVVELVKELEGKRKTDRD